MANLSQADRVGQLTTPLGQDVLVLTGLDATEGMSELFEFQIACLSEMPHVDFDKALGQHCAIRLTTPESGTRWFNGILTEARSTGVSQDLFTYRLVLRPWLWLLAHRADCRIYRDKTVIAIIEDVFKRAGFSNGTDYTIRTSEQYDEIPYCVQYRETDLMFVSRLMEENGIYFFFEHSSEAHKLVLADGLSSHNVNPDVPKIEYRRSFRADKKQYLDGWTSERRYSTGRYELNDYDYQSPSKSLRVSKSSDERYARSSFEVYDFPGRFTDEAKGERFAKFRLEAVQAFDRRRYCDGGAPSFFPGSIVTVQRVTPSAEDGTYLVLRCAHRYADEFYRSSGGTADQSVYRGTYELLPSTRPFRVFPKTPKPKIYGIQTAKVVGKEGQENEEISTDEHGHIWVQFFWDREPRTSCPIRVSQALSGKKWGEIFIPRVGMEVVVEFLEGDPDRPLVTGCVYNGNNKVPFDLPKNKSKSGWKTDSTKGHQGYNQIVFEDKKGEEQIDVHAQKDLQVVVLNDEILHVLRNLIVAIDNKQETVIGKDFKTPMGSPSRKTTIKNGDDQLVLDSGYIEYSSPLKIEFKVAGSTITMTPDGITITAPMIKLN